MLGATAKPPPPTPPKSLAWTTAFAVHILVNTEKGRCYKTADALRWMKTAGFGDVAELEPTAVVEGLKKG